VRKFQPLTRTITSTKTSIAFFLSINLRTLYKTAKIDLDLYMCTRVIKSLVQTFQKGLRKAKVRAMKPKCDGQG